MGEVLKIFISATSADLGAVRQQAWEFFSRHDQYKPFIQEYRDLVPATLLKNDQHHLAECDAVLHIVGECYGAEPLADDAARRSYTQREYDYAREHEKPLYLFFCEDGFPYTAHVPESEEKQTLQRAHREIIEKGEHRYERVADLAALDAALRKVKLETQHLIAELRGAQQKLFIADPLQRYYQNLREQFANYDNVGLPVTAREGKEEKEEPIKIRDLFVPPHCSAQHIRPAELDAAVREGKTLGEPLLPLLEKPGARLVLLADPGMGKSTVVQYLIAMLADEREPVGAPGLWGATPFPFILRELARLLPDDVQKWDWDALVDAFFRWDPRRDGEGPLAAPIASRAVFRTRAGQEDAFFLIDGLDEIGDPIKRVAIRDAIVHGFKRLPKARWLITSRIVGYDRAEVHKADSEFKAFKFGNTKSIQRQYLERGAKGVLVHEEPEKGTTVAFLLWAELHYLAPFDDAQQRAFAEHWYMPRMGEAKGAGRAREFIAAVHQHPHTRVIGRIPNLLYLLALLYRHQAQLPHGRALVYEAISEAYLESIPLQRLLLGDAPAYSQSFPVKEQLLAIVGMKMQQMRASRKEGEDGDILVSREQLGEWLAGRFDSEAALQEFLDHVARHSGLLLPRGEGIYGFAHLSFQEYYAACHLRSDFERIDTARYPPAGGFLRRAAPEAAEHEERIFAEYAILSCWHEPLLFLVEKFHANRYYTAQLLEWMFPQLADDPAESRDWMPYPAAHLLATLSVDPEVALEMRQRVDIWQVLWKADCAAPRPYLHIAPLLVVAGSAFQTGVLQAAASLAPQWLNLSRCAALGDLTPLAGLTSLQSLNLNGSTTLCDLTPLAGLTSLRTLLLTQCTALRDLTPLAGLYALQDLRLSGCSALSDLTPLARLTALEELYLMDCTALSDLTSLGGLINLQSLHLNRCTALSDLTSLAGLTSLQTLDLRGCISLEEEGIAGLRKALATSNIVFE